jgi:PD-(D/E)XK nuclease superfamily
MVDIQNRIDRASHSEVEAYLMCQRRHYYSYGEMLQGKTQDERLIRGIIGHEILAEYYRSLQLGATHKEAATAGSLLLWPLISQFQLFDDVKFGTNLSVLLSHYFQVYENEEIEVLAVEQAYDVPLTEDFTIPVVLDLIARLPGRGVQLLDHKFTYDFYNVDKLDLSPQLPKYVAALDGLGIHVDGMMYNELRTRETKDNKVNIADKFRRTPLVSTPNKVVTIMREQMIAARRIGELKTMGKEEWEQNVLRNPMACNICPFDTLCSADLEGRDSDLVRISFYEEKKRR